MSHELLDIIFKEKDPDKLYLILSKNPCIINRLTDYVAESIYLFFGEKDRIEEQEWFYDECCERNSRAIHTVSLIYEYKLRDEDDVY